MKLDGLEMSNRSVKKFIFIDKRGLWNSIKQVLSANNKISSNENKSNDCPYRRNNTLYGITEKLESKQYVGV